jgi:hypothetical protein
LEQADPNDVPAERVLGLMQMLAVELSSQNTIEMVRDGKDGRYSHRRSPG